MSRLSIFLNPVSPEETQEVVISRRFVGEDGKPAPFIIRALRHEENEAIIKKATRFRKVDGKMKEYMDNGEYSRQIIVAGTVDPDFRDAELCEGYGVVDPAELPGKMLLAGEFNALMREIMRLSGFGDLDIAEEAKN